MFQQTLFAKYLNIRFTMYVVRRKHLQQFQELVHTILRKVLNCFIGQDWFIR